MTDDVDPNDEENLEPAWASIPINLHETCDTLAVTKLRDEASQCLTNEEYYHFVKWLRKCYDRLSPDNDYDLDVG